MEPAPVEIRPERAEDRRAIYDLTRRAFAPMPHAAGDEQDLIDALREKGALVLSLVASNSDEIVGCVAFSPAQASDGSPDWFALGPVAVEPAMQRRGIGSLLIREGIRILASWNAAGCILIGDPRYYKRFGFLRAPRLAPVDVPREYFMVLPLADAAPSSMMAFHPAFSRNR